MNIEELKNGLIQLLDERKPNPVTELSTGMSETRQVLSEIKSTSAKLQQNLDNLNQLAAIARLRQENTAYKYAITYGLKDEVREHLQRQYEKALTATELGINTFDNILRSEDLISNIVKYTKNLESTRYKRSKKTIEEAESTVRQLKNQNNQITKIIDQYKKLINKLINQEAIKQGFEVD